MLCRLTFPAWLILVAVFCSNGSGAQAAENLDGKAVSFEQAIAPLLTARCVSCHNDTKTEGGLSLVHRDTTLGGGDSGASIAPGDPEASLLLDYVSGEEPAMPKGSEPLSEQEVALLRNWIAAGAPWPEGTTLQVTDTWWSRQPLERPEVPKVPANQQHRARTPIDAFVLAKLTEQGMTLSSEADARTIVRRLYYDLTGLPPTPEELAQWNERLQPADGKGALDEAAYRQLVDQLLASPRYGERWARHWLDVVKYADTCGYDKDKLRPNAWPYRDYVIRSFNDDKPYARFVQEQIAGDTLFPGEPDGILGLGFLAAGPWDFIGHAEVPETKIDGKVARNLDRDEMVSNTLNTFCSVTIQCARCHDHKFDPYTQEHYYGLQAVFAAIDRADRPYDLDPQVEQRRRALAAQQQELKQQQAALKKEIVDAGGEKLATLEQQVAALQKNATPRDKRPQYGYHSQVAAAADETKWVQVDLGRPVEIRRIVLHPCHDDYAGIGPGFGFPVRFKIEAADGSDFADATLVADETSADLPNPLLTAYEAPAQVTARFVRVTATHLAERNNDFILALAELEVLDTAGQNVALSGTVDAVDSIEAPVRWGRTNLIDGIWAKPADPAAAEELVEANRKLHILRLKVKTPQRQAKAAHLEAQLAKVENELAKLPRGKLVYAAATHFEPIGTFKPTEGTPRAVHILNRGNVTEPQQPAVPGTLPLPDRPAHAFALPSDHTEADRRAALAQWITDPEHPLTWRSIVNRIWHYHFDQPLVETPNDFGRMGQLPSHPELLDWLALEFRDKGQSFKEMHRLIVTSSVYRQSSEHNAEYAAIDGGNRWLWRMNRRRLEAEEIRDAILSVSGRLDLTMGGPGYYLFVLEKEQHSPHYEYGKFDPADPTSHRRSIYRFVVRSQPDPYMTTLDCADSSQSTPKRDETLTALQALSMLNNDFNLTMAEAFAERLRAEQESLPDQIGRAMQLVAGREPTDNERRQLAAYAQQHGLANLCRVMFNLSEFVYLD